MGLFYTKRGDKGFSHVGKIKISKIDCNIEALGQLDELNCLVGLIKSMQKDKNIKNILHQIQENLFIVQAIVAYKMLGEKRLPPQLGEKALRQVEELIDGIESKLKVEKKFIIPGANTVSAWLDYIRAKSRTAERAVLKTKIKNPFVNAYLNRLSSLFFALARQAAQKQKELSPRYK
jgi:cob(I)alamin adenosyltransferase